MYLTLLFKNSFYIVQNQEPLFFTIWHPYAVSVISLDNGGSHYQYLSLQLSGHDDQQIQTGNYNSVWIQSDLLCKQVLLTSDISTCCCTKYVNYCISVCLQCPDFGHTRYLVCCDFPLLISYYGQHSQDKYRFVCLLKEGLLLFSEFLFPNRQTISYWFCSPLPASPTWPVTFRYFGWKVASYERISWSPH